METLKVIKLLLLVYYVKFSTILTRFRIGV